MSEAPQPFDPWPLAIDAAVVAAVDPAGCGGVWLRAGHGPARDRWLAMLGGMLPASSRLKRVPLHVADSRLLGGLDLAATLQASRPVVERGLLAEADGGFAVLAMAERLPKSTVARITPALDSGEIVLERDGLARRTASRFGVIALDEGMAPDELPPPALIDRLAFHVDLTHARGGDELPSSYSAEDIERARSALPDVSIDEALYGTLCAAAQALGIDSLRAVIFAARVARIAAALAGRDHVTQDDAALAARLVLGPRATRMPVAEQEDDEEEPPQPEPESPPDAEDASEDDSHTPDALPEDILVAAAQAALPPELLTRLLAGSTTRSSASMPGGAGAEKISGARGRPIGVRQGVPGPRARLDVVETLRAAAPWQQLRERERGAARSGRIEVRKSDLRVKRMRQRTETLAIFVVDASGSAALQRLSEAKGAVELLLAECYVRRDQVALLAFRGREAQLLLPPTRSLVRAKRSLAGLPGGGGTPLAAGIQSAIELARVERQRGRTPVIVLLTDGRANIARDGRADRTQAQSDALAAARALRAEGLAGVLVDTALRPQADAERLAHEMDAIYVPLPQANANALMRTVRQATGGSGRSA